VGVDMLSVITLNVITLSVVMLNVVAPTGELVLLVGEGIVVVGPVTG
jgi:hypothetical protein